MIEPQIFWVGKGCTSCSAQGQQAQAVQGFVQSGLKNLWEQKLHNFSGQAAVLPVSSWEKLFLISGLNLQFQLMTIESHSSVPL